jgi:hypothetical protein
VIHRGDISGLTANSVRTNTIRVPLPSKALQDLLDELEASRASRKRAWEILQEIRWVLKEVAGVEAPAPGKRTIDLEGRVVKDAVRKTLQERQKAITDLLNAIREYRTLADHPLTLRGSEYAQAVQTLNKAIDLADRLLR